MTYQSHVHANPEFLNYLSSKRLIYLSPNEKFSVATNAKSHVPIGERLLLNMKEAAELLSMSEQALRDLVHKGQGPEITKRGKRVCFTHEALNIYVESLPREQPYQGIFTAIDKNTSKPSTVEERRLFET